ncbi:MAG: magnesium transporter MgtE [Selenomonadaceae bacterium]|nr:magnesium transporter MgtE [Selenomonadaceae bacterium]
MAEEAPKKKKKGLLGRLFKVFLILFLLLALIVGGFVLGIYLQIFDTKEANEKLGLYRLPVVGDYFVKPAEVTEEELKETPLEDVKPTPEPKKEPEPEKKQSKPVLLSKEEIEKQTQERLAAEKKRVAKLSRLYGQMKPQEAAKAMESMEDDLVVRILQTMDEAQAAKVMGKLDADRAAQLSQMIFEGTQRAIRLPTDNEETEG